MAPLVSWDDIDLTVCATPGVAKGGAAGPARSDARCDHDLSPENSSDDVENLSQIWAVAPALVKLALRDDRRIQFNKEPPWKRIAEGPSSAM